MSSRSLWPNRGFGSSQTCLRMLDSLSLLLLLPFFNVLLIHTSRNHKQVASFIPLWSWDLPVKKSKSLKKKKSGKESKDGATAGSASGIEGPRIVELGPDE